MTAFGIDQIGRQFRGEHAGAEEAAARLAGWAREHGYRWAEMRALETLGMARASSG